jgi:hypothetical protein
MGSDVSRKEAKTQRGQGRGGKVFSLNVGWFERGAVLLGRAHERSEASLRGRLRGVIFEPLSHAKKQRRKGDREGVL